jgi:hypothetical protein
VYNPQTAYSFNNIYTHSIPDRGNGRISSLPYSSKIGSGVHPASYPMGTRGSFPARKADHSPQSCAEFQIVWRYTSTPPVRLHGVVIKQRSVFMTFCSVNHRDSFTLTLTYIQSVGSWWHISSVKLVIDTDAPLINTKP